MKFESFEIDFFPNCLFLLFTRWKLFLRSCWMNITCMIIDLKRCWYWGYFSHRYKLQKHYIYTIYLCSKFNFYDFITHINKRSSCMAMDTNTCWYQATYFPITTTISAMIFKKNYFYFPIAIHCICRKRLLPLSLVSSICITNFMLTQ